MGGEEAVFDGVQRRFVTVGNRRGLHARAAAKFVNVVNLFDAEVTVVKGDMAVPGRSIMGLMMLAAATGTRLEVRASGPQAAAVLAAIAALFARNFDEA
jgi:phosphocarrier protein